MAAAALGVRLKNLSKSMIQYKQNQAGFANGWPTFFDVKPAGLRLIRHFLTFFGERKTRRGVRSEMMRLRKTKAHAKTQRRKDSQRFSCGKEHAKIASVGFSLRCLCVFASLRESFCFFPANESVE
jgi:hypothetical protein